MEITFDTIINYLSTKKDNFINNINIISPIDKFNFDSQMFRKGVLNQNNNINISLIQSLLNLLNSEYIYKNNDEKIAMGNVLINEIKNEWKLNNDKTNLTQEAGIKGIDDLSNGNITDDNYMDILYVLSFCLHINILVLDYITNSSKVVSYYLNENILNVYRPFIILAKNNNDYEPIFNHDKKIFVKNDIINYLTSYTEINLNEIVQTDSVFISEKNTEYTENKLLKLNKKDLYDICDKINIDYKKKDLKKTLIYKILNR